MITIKFAGSGEQFPVKTFKFSGGEIQLKIDELPIKAAFEVTATLNSSDDIMELLLLDEILRRKKSTGSIITIPYLPYGKG